jgi:hypothetical protein
MHRRALERALSRSEPPHAAPLTAPPCRPPQVLRYGLDDDEHCVWWWTLRQDCMPDAYIAHPDYLELVRRLPAGTGVPGADNTVPGGGDLKAAEAAAKGKPEPHVLFLDAVPDLDNVPPPEQGGADEQWNKWTEACQWAKNDPMEP